MPRHYPPANDLSNRALLLAWLALVAIYGLLRVNLVNIPLDRDEGAFALIGKLLLEGGVLYTDGIDHKPPGIFFIFAVALNWVPATAAGVHLFLHGYTLVTLWFVYITCERLGGRAYGLFAAFAFAIASSLPQLQGHTASTEMFLLLPLTLSLLGTLRSRTAGPTNGWLLLSGACAAAACWIKQPAVFAALPLFLHAVWPAAKNGLAGSVMRRTLTWLAGGMAVSTGLVGYFAAQGQLSEFWYWSFVHSALYAREVAPLMALLQVARQLLRVATNVPLLVLLAALGTVHAVRRRRPDHLLLVAFAAGSLAATLPGFAYPHYFAIIVPSLALLASVGLGWLRSVLRLPAGVVPLVVVTSFAIAWLQNAGYYWYDSPHAISRALFGSRPFPESEQIAERIRANTMPGEPIYVYGSEPQVYLLADRPPATGFVLTYPLMSQHYPRQLEFHERVIADLERRHPRYIVVVPLPHSLLWDGRKPLPLQDYLETLISACYMPAFYFVLGADDKTWHEIAARDALPEPWIARPRISVYRRLD